MTGALVPRSSPDDMEKEQCGRVASGPVVWHCVRSYTYSNVWYCMTVCVRIAVGGSVWYCAALCDHMTVCGCTRSV